jgi:hypothetical protein
MGRVFWDDKGWILIASLPRKKIINSVCYVQKRQKLQCANRNKHLMKAHRILWQALTLHAWYQEKLKSLPGKCSPILHTVQTRLVPLKTTNCSGP